jgi:hypothetical protein
VQLSFRILLLLVFIALLLLVYFALVLLVFDVVLLLVFVVATPSAPTKKPRHPLPEAPRFFRLLAFSY